MRLVSLLTALLAAVSAIPAGAQDLRQAIVFGDSTMDSGWFRGALAGNCDGVPAPCTTGNVFKDNRIANAIALGGTSAPVGVGPMNSQLLASYFGLSADPVNEPGGTNYAISGATNTRVAGFGNLHPNANLPATVEQIANYLASVGGRANSDALYVISSGGNDISYAIDNIPTLLGRQAFLAGSAAQLVSAAGSLQDAGVRFLVVPNLYGTGALAVFYGDALWSGLASVGVNFIPADIRSVVQAIEANPTPFGFTAATVQRGVPGAATGSACRWDGPPAAVGWGLFCANTTVPGFNNYAYLRSADAQQTSLFSDDQHFSAAGQKIEADYIYSLIVAPSQISLLAETAVKTRMRLVSNIQTQIEATRQQAPGPSGLNVWITGDVSHLEMENYRGFPDDPSTPAALAAGISGRFPGGVIVGASISAGRLEADFSKGRGDFEQEELSGSVYAGLLGGPLWGTLIGTYGSLDYDVNRLVPLGITVQSNSGQTDGRNVSLAAQAGYNFTSGVVTHGPVVGLTWQRIEVDGFTETGSVTSLAFGDQSRESVISALGYRATLDWGAVRPFAQLVWHHELASTDREVTAFLTTTTAPGYHMPAVALGKDWGTATIGANLKLGGGVSALAAFSTDFGQDDAVTYGAQLGLNVAF